MKATSAIAGGLCGAAALTLIHETERRFIPNAPRMDLLGMQALAKLLKHADATVPSKPKLFNITMAGDIAGNALYYSLAGVGHKKYALLRGAVAGLAAGIGAVYLPGLMGLSKAPSSRTLTTKLMTVGLYLAGGLVAGTAAKIAEEKS